MSKKKILPCPCGGGAYESCCARYIEQGQVAPTAEALMRSRYSAYALGREDYLRKTWHESTRPADAILSDEEALKWTSLDIKNHEWQAGASTAKVEFLAKYKVQGRAHRLHEISDFVQEQGHWFYVSGVYPDEI